VSTELSVKADSYLMLSEPDRVGAILEANLGGERLRMGDLDQVKIPTGGMTQWAVEGPEGQTFVPNITGIIVHQHNQRAYYQGEYTGGNEKPDCSSPDGHTPYGNPGDELRLAGKSCEDCPLSQFGSGKNGGQACRQSRRVYVVQPGSLLPVVITLSPTSLASMRKYLLRLGTVPYYSVVTRFILKQAVSKNGIKYSVAIPEMVGKLDAEQVQNVVDFREALIDSMRYVPQQDSVDEVPF